VDQRREDDAETSNSPCTLYVPRVAVVNWGPGISFPVVLGFKRRQILVVVPGLGKLSPRLVCPP